MQLEFWGHRGSQTDHAVARAYGRPAQPAENTLAAFAQALDGGADGIELDVIRTKASPGDASDPGDRLVVTHTNDSSAHLFDDTGQPAGQGFISDLTTAEVKALRAGPNRDGEIPSLNETLAFFAAYEKSQAREVALNIEIKDAKDTAFPSRERSDVVPLLADALARSPLARKRLLISSFALDDLIRMQRLAPDLRLGLLCYGHAGEAKPLYPAIRGSENYLPFTDATIATAVARLPSLVAVHPEIRDIDRATMRAAARCRLDVNPWFTEEEKPEQNFALVKEKFAIAADAGIEHLHLISNFAGEWRGLLGASQPRISEREKTGIAPVCEERQP